MKKAIEELEQIQQERVNEEKRRNKSISLGFCPECGESITVEYNPKIFFRTWDKKLFCSVDQSHYFRTDVYGEYY